MTKRVAFVIYPNFDLLDLSGPVAVFNDANAVVPGAYRLEMVSPRGGPIASSSGVTVDSVRPADGGIDTLIVLGGPIPTVRNMEPRTLMLVSRLAKDARRIGSICTGAFLLATAGLLDGRRATTHWKGAAEMQAAFPKALVEADSIFTQDGNVWTSAGATAGIDLALAMIEEDLGLEVSRNVARGLVVYHRRLGGQSQYSALLEMELASDRIKRTLAYAREHVREDLSVPKLAEVANLSVRQFSRAFLAETGCSPAKAVERIRAEVAKPHVEGSRLSLDEIARLAGFSDAERMRQAFVRAFGRPPQAFRRGVKAGRDSAPPDTP